MNNAQIAIEKMTRVGHESPLFLLTKAKNKIN